ncbi:MAG: hypothetical protein ACSHXY_08705 [Alphaproteobacteria bacterium]
MTHQQTDTEIALEYSRTDMTAPPQFPCGPEIWDTSALRAVIPALIARLFTLFSPEGVQRGAMSRLWDIRRMIVQLHRAEAFNFTTWLIRSMQSNRAWQTQIREDLGGEPALQRWERRREKMLAPPSESVDIVNPQTVKEPEKRKASKPKKDRYGLFRLASLSRETVKAPSLRLPIPSLPRNAGASLLWPKPIGLTPDQLRPPEVACSPNGNDIEGSADTRVSQNPNTPSLTREALIKIWERLHAQHSEWNHRLMIAGIMMTTPPIRGAYSPP